MKTERLPDFLFLAGWGIYKAGLAIRLSFTLTRNRRVSFITFIGNAILVYRKERLLDELERVEKLSLPGCANLREDFTGQIEAEALTESEVEKAILDYHRHAKHWKCPPGYLRRLKRALKLNAMSTGKCLLVVEKTNVTD